MNDEEYVLDIAPGLKNYYDSIAGMYDKMHNEIRSLIRLVDKSFKPFFIEEEALKITRKVNWLANKIDILANKIDFLLDEKNFKTPVPKKDPEFLQMRIDAKFHSTRLYNCLKKGGFSFYEEVLDNSERLIKVGSFGKKMYKELSDFFYARGYLLKNIF